MSITRSVDELVAAITAAGVPATASPDIVLAKAAQVPVMAYVDAPTVEGITTGGGVALTIPVHLIVRPPGGRDELTHAWDVLPGLIRLLHCTDPAQPGTVTVADKQLPGYNLTTRARIAC